MGADKGRNGKLPVVKTETVGANRVYGMDAGRTPETREFFGAPGRQRSRRRCAGDLTLPGEPGIVSG